MSPPPLSLELRSLALLLDQGAALGPALERLGSRAGSEGYRKAAERVGSGASLAEAAADWPEWLRQMLGAEQSGDLPERLRQCASLWDGRKQRQSSWRNVLVYPVLLWVACLLVGLVVSLVCQSQISLLELRDTSWTQAIRLLTGWYLALYPVWLLSPLALGWALSKESLRARFPILGLLARQRDAASFLGWLELSLTEGRPLPEALEQAASSCVLAPMRREMLDTARRCREGSGLGEAVSSLKVWPPLARWGLIQAEQSHFRAESMRGLARILEEKAAFQGVFLNTALTLATYLLAGAVLLIWSLGALLPVTSMIGDF